MDYKDDKDGYIFDVNYKNSGTYTYKMTIQWKKIINQQQVHEKKESESITKEKESDTKTEESELIITKESDIEASYLNIDTKESDIESIYDNNIPNMQIYTIYYESQESKSEEVELE
jgi:hypothetical protein